MKVTDNISNGRANAAAPDSIRGVLPEVHVVPAINRRYDKTQLFYIWRHGRKRRVPIAKLVEPPIEVASSIPTGGLVKSANSEDHPAATAMKFLSDLRTGRAAAYNQCGTSRQLRGISIVARVYLKKVGWQLRLSTGILGA